MRDKIIELKKKKLVNLASAMVDKYLLFDNPVFRIPKPNIRFLTLNLKNLTSEMCTVDAV